MTYDAMDTYELRAALEEWHDQIVKLAGEYRQAVVAENVVWAEGIGLALDQALGQAKRVRALLRVGAAA